MGKTVKKTKLILVSALFLTYSRTSMARAPMARLPRLFRTRLESLGKNPIAADIYYIWDNLE